jgi:hypothetical protein
MPKKKQKQKEAISHILHNNKYDTSLLNKLRKTDKIEKEKVNTQNTKWAKFTCVGKETKFITKLFKNTNLRIAFTTKNSICELLSKQNNSQQDKFDRSRVYCTS